jgi:transglutaminase 1
MASMSSMSPMSSPMLSMDYRSSSSPSTTVLRRGQPFFMAIRMKDRNFDPRRDILRASFTFGKQTVTKLIVVEFSANIMTFRPQSSSDQGNQSRFAFPHESARIQPGPAKVGHASPSTGGFQHHLPSKTIQNLNYLAVA